MSTRGRTVDGVERDLVDIDRRRLIHPNLDESIDERCVLVRGDGCRLWDADGVEYLDSTAGLWLVQVGHGRAEIADVAARQMRDLAYFTGFRELSNDRAIELAEKLIEIVPGSMSKIHYTSGGSEGVETAIKMVRLYHYRRGEPNRRWILSRNLAYHGLGYGSGTATGMAAFHTGFGIPLAEIEHLSAPHTYREELFDGQAATDYLVAELEATIERIGAENIAAMIAEPVMGAGGLIIPPDDYWLRICAVLRRHEILLIADEVVTGFGRTGGWFASEGYDMRPDLMVLAKGITSGYVPLGAVLVNEAVGDVVSSADGFRHGFTYFGHPVACAVALENIRILEEEDLPAESARKGPLLLEELAPLADHPLVGDIRGKGLTAAIEFVSDRQTREPFSFASGRTLEQILRTEYQVIARQLGSIIAFSPPLVITEDELSRLGHAVRDAVSRLQPDGTFS